MMIDDLVTKEILKQKGYAAPEPSGAIKLDSNENTFPMQEPLRKKLMERISEIDINRYPDAGAPLLCERFAAYYGVKKNMMMTGNGSDELIQMLCTALKGKIKGVLIPVPTFSMYKIIGINAGNKVEEVPLDEKFDLDVDAMLARIKKDFPSIIFLSRPNNPTGNNFSAKSVEKIIKKAPGIVVVDEAYDAFADESLLSLLKKYDNVVFLKTLSKMGLAAIRLGFLIGNARLVSELDKVRLPYNVNALTQAVGNFYLDYEKEFTKQIMQIAKNREELYRGLKEIKWIKPYPSKANFIFFSCAFDSNRIYNRLAREGVIIKNLNNPRIPDCMRVTIGTKKENEAFLKALKKVTPE